MIFNSYFTALVVNAHNMQVGEDVKNHEEKETQYGKDMVNVNSRKRIQELLKDNGENINGIAKDNTIKNVPKATEKIK